MSLDRTCVATTNDLDDVPPFWKPLCEWVRTFVRAQPSERATLRAIAAAAAKDGEFAIFSRTADTVRQIIGYGALRLVSSSPRVIDAPAMKECIDCKLTKSRSSFYRHHGTRDGLQSRCRDCDNTNRIARSKNEIVPAARVEHAVNQSRKRIRPRTGEYVYEGVSGGPLLAGYVP